MRLFKKHTGVSASDKAAGWMANLILTLQKIFSDFFARRSASWKRKQQWIFLYVICLVFGGLSVLAVVQSFKTQSLSKVSAIKVSRIIHKESKVRITENEFRQVQRFKNSLDSIALKRLMETRPGLMDSLEMVEQMYYSQKK